jgi:repressor LexA
MHPTQQKILNLAKKVNLSGKGPREISKLLKEEIHPQIIKHHLEQLKRKGLLYIDLKTKGTKVSELGAFKIDKLFSLPIFGRANCGEALELAQENLSGYLKVTPRVMERSNPVGLFVIKAVGESMNRATVQGEDNIEDGDYVIVDSNKQPQNGDYVLSVIDGAANIKKFVKDEKRREIRLISESTLNIPPIILHEDDLIASNYTVNGVIARVIKN